MSNSQLVIYGAGHLGRQYLHHIDSYHPELHVVGFVDDVLEKGQPVQKSLKTLGSLDQASQLASSCRLVFAIGYNDLEARARALQKAQNHNFELFTFVHPRAIVEPGSTVGVGTFLLAGAIVDQQVEIGRACFIDIGVRLGAGTIVESNTFICSGACTGSRVKIGANSFIGMNSTITTDVKVGDNTFVNAGSLIARDLPANIKHVEHRKSRGIPN